MIHIAAAIRDAVVLILFI